LAAATKLTESEPQLVASGNTLEVIDEVTVTSGETTNVINEQDIAVTMETA
jgi:hypothetical protein